VARATAPNTDLAGVSPRSLGDKLVLLVVVLLWIAVLACMVFDFE
jgi:hypothetical protein